MKKIIQRLLVIGCGMGVLDSCSVSLPPPISHDSLTKEQRALVKKTPIVDIHVHTFNSKFLPTKGIALGKRDAHWLATFAAEPIVHAAVEIIDGITEVNRRRSKKFRFAEFTADNEVVEAASEEVDQEFAGEGHAKPVEIVEHPLTRGIAKVLTEDGGDLTWREEQFVRNFGALFSQGHGGGGIFRGLSNKYDRNIAHFLRRVTRDEGKIVWHYLRDQEQPVNLFVSHMMDLAPIYDQKEGTDLLFDYGKILETTRKQKRQVNRSGLSEMLYFVAYNPFRDHWRGGKPGDALRLVKEAYEKKGATGVKVYPPSGYRVANNEIRRPPFTILNPHACRQYRARYEVNGKKMSNDDLNKRLDQLFTWAAKNDVPIFTHAGVGEFEARRDYGVYHSNPKYWEMVLEKHPTLRLCFGHAGGEAHWFQEKKHADWGERVERLCGTYQNVYCEFGAFDHITEEEHRARFVETIEKGIEKSGPGTPHLYSFADKVIYGSDYFMPLSSGHSFADYLKAFQLAGIAIEGNGQGKKNGFYRKFFNHNARAFLKR